MPHLALAADDDNRPNILVIVTDDQGYGDLSAYSHHAADIDTPNLDRLAGEGVLFTQAYVSAPVCSPSRAGWNTGRYQQRWDPRASWSPGLPNDEKTLAEYLKGTGYTTGKVGKNDFGDGYHTHEPREYPLNHGFDEFLGFSAHAHDYFLLSHEIEKKTPDPHGASATLGALLHNDGFKSYDEGYTTEIFTDSAIDFMKRHRQTPFFLSLCYNSVHHLIHEVPERYLKKYGAKQIPNYNPETMGRYRKYYNTYNELDPISDEDMRRYYLANLDCIDDNIGRLLTAMDKLNLTENTLVIFFADNGGSPLTGANNRPLRGSKYILYEGGIRVPFAMRWPGQLPSGAVCKQPVSTLDVLPTCLEAADAPVPGYLDGQSILPVIERGESARSSQRPMFWKWQGNFAVRRGDWKLVKTHDYTRRKPTSQILQGPTSKQPQLFNLRKDPAEQHDLSDEHPRKVKELRTLYDRWAKSIRQ